MVAAGDGGGSTYSCLSISFVGAKFGGLGNCFIIAAFSCRHVRVGVGVWSSVVVEVVERLVVVVDASEVAGVDSVESHGRGELLIRGSDQRARAASLRHF